MLKRLLIVAALLLIVAAGGAYLLYNHYTALLEPVDPASDRELIVEIPPGAGTEYIALILEDEGLIQNELAFRVFVRLNDIGHTFMAGRYLLTPAMSLEQITDKIRAGEVYTETAWFTVPEGLNIEEIAAVLEQKNLADSAVFLALAAKPSAAILEQFPFLQEVDDPHVTYLLEGYLFPDTYEVYSDASEEEMIVVMLRRMEAVFTEEARQQLSALGITMHEALTMASIVEREGRVDHERPIIAGVFYNRLTTGQKLESCATVQYVLEETKEILTFEDLRIPSPYNTYQNAGLPPGPIASPGEPSILAALNPEDTDYFYFNYKHDGSGEHFFSRTLEEHNRNVRLAEENLR